MAPWLEINPRDRFRIFRYKGTVLFVKELYGIASCERSSSMTNRVPLSINRVSVVHLGVKLSGHTNSLNTTTHHCVWLLVHDLESTGHKSCFMNSLSDLMLHTKLKSLN